MRLNTPRVDGNKWRCYIRLYWSALCNAGSFALCGDPNNEFCRAPATNRRDLTKFLLVFLWIHEKIGCGSQGLLEEGAWRWTVVVNPFSFIKWWWYCHWNSDTLSILNFSLKSTWTVKSSLSPHSLFCLSLTPVLIGILYLETTTPIRSKLHCDVLNKTSSSQLGISFLSFTAGRRPLP